MNLYRISSHVNLPDLTRSNSHRNSSDLIRLSPLIIRGCEHESVDTTCNTMPKFTVEVSTLVYCIFTNCESIRNKKKNFNM